MIRLGRSKKDFYKYKRNIGNSIRSFLNTAKSKEPVFILATGRSGTHFLTKTLLGNHEITDLNNGRENPYVFPLVTEFALHNCNDKALLSEIINRYKKLINIAAPLQFLDQSHPNIWLADELNSSFPNCKFILILRNPYSVVYSMLNKNLGGWIEHWDKYPVPNPFLGITVDNIERYKSMSTIEKCAMRWASHFCQSISVQEKYSDSTYICRYEQLCLYPEYTLDRIKDFLNLNTQIPVPVINKNSLYKFEELDAKEIKLIKETVLNFINSCTFTPKNSNEMIGQYIDDPKLEEEIIIA